jgi:excisionase family DNA binding protein
MEQENDSDLETLLLAKEVAAWLRTGLSTIYQWADTNQIPHVRINGMLRFSKADVATWLHSGAKAPQSQPLPQAPHITGNHRAVSNSVMKQTARRVRARAFRSPRDIAT